MLLTDVVTATNMNPTYYKFIPIFIKCWKRLFPSINIDESISKKIMFATKEQACCLSNNRKYCEKIKRKSGETVSQQVKQMKTDKNRTKLL